MRDNYDGHVGVDRREPKITQQDYLTLNRLSKLLEKSVEKHLLEQKAAILDIGCGKKPYQPFFLGKSDVYIGVDVNPSESVDILCDIQKLPFKESYFSASLCLQVLEHVDDPRIAIDEIFRVLKPEGLLLLSTHGNWPVHELPNDYWRWTEYGLEKMLTGFHIHEIHRCGGSVVSIIQLLELLIPTKSLGIILILFLNLLGDLLDGVAWLSARLPHLVTNYVIVARRQKKKSKNGLRQEKPEP